MGGYGGGMPGYRPGMMGGTGSGYGPGGGSSLLRHRQAMMSGIRYLRTQ